MFMLERKLVTVSGLAELWSGAWARASAKRCHGDAPSCPSVQSALHVRKIAHVRLRILLLWRVRELSETLERA